MTETIIGIIGIILSAATLAAMIFGVRLGGKAMFSNVKVYGTQADERFNAIKGKLPAAAKYYDGPYQGGAGLIAPQFEVERFRYDGQTMGTEWKGVSKLVHYYTRGNDGIKEESWRL